MPGVSGSLRSLSVLLRVVMRAVSFFYLRLFTQSPDVLSVHNQSMIAKEIFTTPSFTVDLERNGASPQDVGFVCDCL